jgi:hypothetical protein
MNSNLKLTMDSILDSLSYRNNTISITGDSAVELKITSRASRALLDGLIEELSPKERKRLANKIMEELNE